MDGKSLVGITQERAADIMMHTGQVVELEVAMQVNQAGNQSAGGFVINFSKVYVVNTG